MKHFTQRWVAELADAVIEQVEIQIKYAGYIGKQVDDVERARAYDDLRLPAGLGLFEGHRAEL